MNINSMTWDELKTYIDSELRKANLDGSVAVKNITLSCPGDLDTEVVVEDANGKLFVSILMEEV